jgi:hypothetical protein
MAGSHTHRARSGLSALPGDCSLDQAVRPSGNMAVDLHFMLVYPESKSLAW